MDQGLAFLEQEIASATPAKLRLLLIQKARSLCGIIQELESTSKSQQTGQWIILLQDILTELLQGVTDPNNPAAPAVADLYVFLCQRAVQAMVEREMHWIREIEEVLAIEDATWSSYVDQEIRLSAPPVENPEKALALRVDSTLNRLDSILAHASVDTNQPLDLEC